MGFPVSLRPVAFLQCVALPSDFSRLGRLFLDIEKRRFLQWASFHISKASHPCVKTL